MHAGAEACSRRLQNASLTAGASGVRFPAMKPEITIAILAAAILLHVPLVLALGFIVLDILVPEKGHGTRARRAASSPPRLRGEWGWLGVGRAW